MASSERMQARLAVRNSDRDHAGPNLPSWANGIRGTGQPDVAVRGTQAPQRHPHGGALRRRRVAGHSGGRHGAADVWRAGLDRAQPRGAAGDRLRADDAVLVDLRADAGGLEARVRDRPRYIDHVAYSPAHRSLDHGSAGSGARLFRGGQVRARAGTQCARDCQRGRSGFRHGVDAKEAAAPTERRIDRTLHQRLPMAPLPTRRYRRSSRIRRSPCCRCRT